MSPKQQALLDKARKSIRSAKLELRDGAPEFAVSRAYYAMFYVAQAFLIGRGLAYKKHTAVVSEFGRLFAVTRIVPPEFHGYLLDAMEARNIADYWTEPELSPDDAGQTIERAIAFLEFAQQFLSSTTDQP